MIMIGGDIVGRLSGTRSDGTVEVVTGVCGPDADYICTRGSRSWQLINDTRRPGGDMGGFENWVYEQARKPLAERK